MLVTDNELRVYEDKKIGELLVEFVLYLSETRTGMDIEKADCKFSWK